MPVRRGVRAETETTIASEADSPGDSLSKGIQSIGLGSAGQTQSQGQGQNGYGRSPSYTSNKDQRPG